MHAYKTILVLLCLSLGVRAQNALSIPPVLTGATFNLEVQNGTRSFYPPVNTPTLGINGGWMAPTVVVNKGDSITLNVINNLNQRTTMHWHGLHVSPKNDGGPHQSINAGATWSPSFKVRNNAGTFWYHPHGAGQTDPQISRGLAGFFIIHDAQEQALPIPHAYGQDDFPLMVQSKAFDELGQIMIASNMDTALFVNGTLHPYLDAPAQVIRLRLLNASSLRSYNFGLSGGQTLYQIGTDGGLLDTPRSLNRLLLSPGERAEVLINLSGMAGTTLYLKSFGSEIPEGVYGAAVVGAGADTIHEYAHNMLNGADFDLLRINVVAATASPVTAIPATLVPLAPFDPALATHHRTIVLDTLRLLPADVPNRADGPFGINNMTFDMDVVNETVYLNTTEIWTIKNHTLVAHPFHIHDIQFNVIQEGGINLPPAKMGWKDVVVVRPGDSVKVLTKFETFADPHVPYMYHCHLLHHEDDGMMGTFLVVDTTTTGIQDREPAGPAFRIAPNPAHNQVTLYMEQDLQDGKQMVITDLTGRQVYAAAGDRREVGIDVADWPKGVYFLTVNGKQGKTTRKLVIW